jgi:intracellular septation protein
MPPSTSQPLAVSLRGSAGQERPDGGGDGSARTRNGTGAFVRGDILAKRLAVEMGPLLVFFFAFYLYDIFLATTVFMAATTLAVILSSAEKRLPVLPLISLALVLLFGGLTLYWEDPHFIKMRPTAINLFYGLAMAASWVVGAPLLKHILAPGLSLSDEGWQKLTLRLALFLFALAALNEVVWRSFDTEVWVVFKTFGAVLLNIVFAVLQIRLLRRHVQAGG